MRFLLFGLILIASPARAGDDWTTGDTVRQGALTTLLIVDWTQTRYIAKHPRDPTRQDGTYQWRAEGNNLLGAYPSVGRVNSYFAASIVGHAVISYMLPRPWREGWQYIWIGIEIDATSRNQRMGIKLEF